MWHSGAACIESYFFAKTPVLSDHLGTIHCVNSTTVSSMYLPLYKGHMFLIPWVVILYMFHCIVLQTGSFQGGVYVGFEMGDGLR